MKSALEGQQQEKKEKIDELKSDLRRLVNDRDRCVAEVSISATIYDDSSIKLDHFTTANDNVPKNKMIHVLWLCRHFLNGFVTLDGEGDIENWRMSRTAIKIWTRQKRLERGTR